MVIKNLRSHYGLPWFSISYPGWIINQKSLSFSCSIAATVYDLSWVSTLSMPNPRTVCLRCGYCYLESASSTFTIARRSSWLLLYCCQILATTASMITEFIAVVFGLIWPREAWHCSHFFAWPPIQRSCSSVVNLLGLEPCLFASILSHLVSLCTSLILKDFANAHKLSSGKMNIYDFWAKTKKEHKVNLIDNFPTNFS